MQDKIEEALSELRKFNVPWQKMIKKQLEYCRDVELEKKSPDKLEELNMGLIVV